MVCSIVQTLVCSVVTFHASTPQEWLGLRWVEVLLLLVRTRVSSAKSPFPLSAQQSPLRHQYQRNCHHNRHYLHCCLYLCQLSHQIYTAPNCPKLKFMQICQAGYTAHWAMGMALLRQKMKILCLLNLKMMEPDYYIPWGEWKWGETGIKAG